MTTSFQSFYAVLAHDGSGATPADSQWSLRTQDGVILATYTGTFSRASAWAETVWARRSNDSWPLYGCEKRKRTGLGSSRTFEIY